MLGTTFYHETTRRIVIAFGTLFNNISVRKSDSSSTVQKTIKVPLAYAPKAKFIQRLRQADSADPNADRRLQMTLPRMGFEMTGMNYDSTRKLNTMRKHLSQNSATTLRSTYQRVPYTWNLTLYITTKLADEGLQIVEQILPYFTPHFNINSIKDIPDSLNILHDAQLVLTGVTQEDTFEGDLQSRRMITWNLEFEMRGYVYGPISGSSGLIKKAIIQFYDSLTDTTVEPYLDADGQPLTAQPPRVVEALCVAVDPQDAEPDDDFGFIEEIGYLCIDNNFWVRQNSSSSSSSTSSVNSSSSTSSVNSSSSTSSVNSSSSTSTLSSSSTTLTSESSTSESSQSV